MSDTTPSLKATLRTDMVASMKAKDPLRTATLRMLMAAIQTEEVAGKEARVLTDEEIIKVLAKESKKRGESAEIYTENGRGELAAKERAEAQIIDEYLPTPLTDAELVDVVDTARNDPALGLAEGTYKVMALLPAPPRLRLTAAMLSATALVCTHDRPARMSES